MMTVHFSLLHYSSPLPSLPDWIDEGGKNKPKWQTLLTRVLWDFSAPDASTPSDARTSFLLLVDLGESHQ